MARAIVSTVIILSLVFAPCNAFTLKNIFTSERSSAMNAELEGILWDMDGVLADTERDGHRPAFNQAFKENKLDTDWDVDRYGKLLEVGGGKERMTAHWNEVGWPDAIPEEGRQDKVKEVSQQKDTVEGHPLQRTL